MAERGGCFRTRRSMETTTRVPEAPRWRRGGDTRKLRRYEQKTFAPLRYRRRVARSRLALRGLPHHGRRRRGHRTRGREDSGQREVISRAVLKCCARDSFRVRFFFGVANGLF